MSAQAPGLAAFAAHWEHALGRPLKLPDAWDMQAPQTRADWEAAENAVRKPLLAEIAALRELLDEVGVLAANAPEDGDSFAVCEQIAMRIAAFGVPAEPDDGRHPDDCTCQFCREDERAERDRDDRIEAAEEAEFLRDAASLDTDFEEDL